MSEGTEEHFIHGTVWEVNLWQRDPVRETQRPPPETETSCVTDDHKKHVAKELRGCWIRPRSPHTSLARSALLLRLRV